MSDDNNNTLRRSSAGDVTTAVVALTGDLRGSSGSGDSATVTVAAQPTAAAATTTTTSTAATTTPEFAAPVEVDELPSAKSLTESRSAPSSPVVGDWAGQQKKKDQDQGTGSEETKDAADDGKEQEQKATNLRQQLQQQLEQNLEQIQQQTPQQPEEQEQQSQQQQAQQQPQQQTRSVNSPKLLSIMSPKVGLHIHTEDPSVLEPAIDELLSPRHFKQQLNAAIVAGVDTSSSVAGADDNSKQSVVSV
eukprot:TRINITY_DN2945_c0_g1_i2.p2 TRINITY_DN2945_c0_g1~~TRINITY_DN2945_c0_g1_i2.p2  ORF type:complete len:248 (-),score=112.77 TRINITY_DN2945_c0_g1_i2:363-1106(-)